MQIDINSLTLGQLKEIAELTKTKVKARASKIDHGADLPFKIGDAILIRTVTMIQVGRVTALGRDSITLEDASWIADTGRFSTLLEKGEPNEVERCPGWVLVGRGAIVDVFPWTHELPKRTK